MKIKSNISTQNLNFLYNHFFKEKDKTSRELTDLLKANERKFDGETYRPDLWETYHELYARYIECDAAMSDIKKIINTRIEYVRL